MSRFCVIKDTREKDGWDFPESNTCLGTVIKKLDTGDYSAKGYEDLVCIERKKSTSEIANNISQPRFKRELERMQKFKYRFLICEFSFRDVKQFPLNSGIPEKALANLKISSNYLMRCISEIQILYGINVVFADNRETAMHAVYNILRRISEIEEPCPE